MTEPAVTEEFHFYHLVDKPSRHAIRQAARDADHGPVWVVNRAGTRIAAVVSVESARFLEEMRQSLDQAERGETLDLGSFAQYADDEG